MAAIASRTVMITVVGFIFIPPFDSAFNPLDEIGRRDVREKIHGHFMLPALSAPPVMVYNDLGDRVGEAEPRSFWRDGI